MKRIITALLSALLTLSLCSCGSQNAAEQTSSVPESSAAQTAVISESCAQKESSPSAKEEPSAYEEPRFSDTTDYSGTFAARFVDAGRLSDRTKKNAVDIINGNAFYIDADGTLSLPGGVSMEFSAAAAKDGEKLFLRTSAYGNDSLFIRNGDGIYSVDTSNDQASLIKDGELSPFYSNEVISTAFTCLSYLFGSSELSFVKGGSEEFEGSVLSFEEYKAGGSTIKLYYDGDTLKYVTAENSGAVSQVRINRLSAQPDPALFVLPGGTASA